MVRAIEQFWSTSHCPLAPGSDRLFSAPPKLGMVIGTFAAAPYVHLQLEARRRLLPGIPALVHDDGSHQRDLLRALCREYACDFESNSERLPRHLGDLSVFFGGLKWAEQNGVELLLKVSRRWIFLVDWTGDLAELAMQSQYATYSNYTESFGFGFRTECIGMAVRMWATPRIYRPLIERITKGEAVFVEGYIHQFAIELEGANCAQANDWKASHPTAPDRRGYAAWSLMGTDRMGPQRPTAYLWHDAHSQSQYARQAARWGLRYTEEDFLDPNQGAGLGPENVEPPGS